ncbi:MAG TPA: hypothetical protein VIJ62_04635 [Rhizomicrobium sp.]
MAETVVITQEREENAGYRFSWALVFAGAFVATAITFFLFTLGSGVGLLLVNPVAHTGPSTTAFVTGGAIYFFAAQAFAFAVGGHLAGRFLGPLVESRIQEDFRAAAHGLSVWALTVVATLILVAVAGLTAANTGGNMAAMYGASSSHTADAPTPMNYLVDKLFRPGPAAQASANDTTPSDQTASAPASTDATQNVSGGTAVDDKAARAEATRILDVSFARGEQLSADDHERLVALVSQNAQISSGAAADRIDGMQADIQNKTRQAADAARKAASYASLWIAFSLLFGAIVAIFAAISARIEDDRESLQATRSNM